MRLTPPASAASHSPQPQRLARPRCNATSDDEQAVSTVTAGPSEAQSVGYPARRHAGGRSGREIRIDEIAVAERWRGHSHNCRGRHKRRRGCPSALSGAIPHSRALPMPVRAAAAAADPCWRLRVAKCRRTPRSNWSTCFEEAAEARRHLARRVGIVGIVLVERPALGGDLADRIDPAPQDIGEACRVGDAARQTQGPCRSRRSARATLLRPPARAANCGSLHQRALDRRLRIAVMLGPLPSTESNCEFGRQQSLGIAHR